MLPLGVEDNIAANLGPEREVAIGFARLVPDGKLVLNRPGYDADKDFLLVFRSGMTVSYEVKCDWMSERTGNVFIETDCSGAPSGVRRTKAQVWLHYLPGKGLATFSPARMAEHLAGLGRIGRLEGVGDGNASGHLIRFRDLVLLWFVGFFPGFAVKKVGSGP